MSAKSVAIVSRHAVPNYGSLLQAYALQKAIEGLGHRAFYIDYRPPDGSPVQTCRYNLRRLSTWNQSPATRAAYMSIRVPEFAFQAVCFARWRSSMLRLSPKIYRDDSQLRSDYPRADLYCTGSDQVWNTTPSGILDENYVLEFLGPSARRFSYAASFGTESLKSDDVDQFSQNIRKYEKVSVREPSGLSILASLGVHGEVVLDPTMLITAESWKSMLPDRAPKAPFMLVYQLHGNADFDAYAQAMADAKGLKLIRVTSKIHELTRSGGMVLLPKPEDFLWHINNAELVLTDSFHGTAFSILFNTPFLSVLPPEFEGRNLGILERTGLTSRIVEGISDLTVSDQAIDFTAANAIIRSERETSMRYLQTALDG